VPGFEAEGSKKVLSILLLEELLDVAPVRVRKDKFVQPPSRLKLEQVLGWGFQGA
jgi:hypothetical protein